MPTILVQICTVATSKAMLDQITGNRILTTVLKRTTMIVLVIMIALVDSCVCPDVVNCRVWYTNISVYQIANSTLRIMLHLNQQL